MLAWTLLLLLQASPPAPSARLHVLQGRASLATPSGIDVLPAGGAPVRVAPRGHLELAVLSRAELRWDRVGSLELTGPAALEWRSTSASRTEATLLSFQDLHLELRRGPLLLELPGGWRLLAEGGAAAHMALSPSGLDLHHAAGRPLLLLRPSPPDQARPPLTLLPGARVRLSGPDWSERGPSGRALDPFRRGDGGVEGERKVDAWAGFSWPWGDAGTLRCARNSPPDSKHW
jgi:hypothetical protein